MEDVRSVIFRGESRKQGARNSFVLSENAVFQVIEIKVEPAYVVKKRSLWLDIVNVVSYDLTHKRLLHAVSRIRLNSLQVVVEVHALIYVEEEACSLRGVQRYDVDFLQLTDLVLVCFKFS